MKELPEGRLDNRSPSICLITFFVFFLSLLLGFFFFFMSLLLFSFYFHIKYFLISLKIFHLVTSSGLYCHSSLKNRWADMSPFGGLDFRKLTWKGYAFLIYATTLPIKGVLIVKFYLMEGCYWQLIFFFFLK